MFLTAAPQAPLLNALGVRYLLGLLSAGLLAWALITWLAPLGWMDHPDERKPHARPTPRTGGLALGLVCLALFLLKQGPLDFNRLEVLGCLGMSILGFIDDRRSLEPTPKAALGLTFAAVITLGAAAELHARTPMVSLFGMGISTNPIITFVPLLLWFWSIPQAFNLSDGLNGLALGLFGLAMALVGGVGLGASPAFWGAWAAIVLLNFPRARHFLGDCGSLGMGAAMSILMIRWASTQDAGLALWVGAYWVADVTAVVLIRSISGRPLGQGDLNHLHHRMLELTGRRVGLATPLLLVMGGLPMLKALDYPGAQGGALLGLILLTIFAVVHVAYAVRKPVRVRASKVADPESGAFPVGSVEL